MTSPEGEGAEDGLDASPAAHTAQMDDLDTLMRPRLTRRARLLRAGALIALIAVVAAGLAWRVSGESLPFSAAIATAIPSPTVGVVPLLLITSNVNYGTLTINGRRVAGTVAVFRPRRGQNTITLTAEPFAPTTCTFSWPGFSRSSGPCSYGDGSPQDVTVGGEHYSVSYNLDISMRGDQLSAEECARVKDAVSSALDATRPAIAVPTGQYIATGAYRDGLAVVQRTEQRLVARLAAALPAAMGSTPCAEFGETGWSNPEPLQRLQGRHWLTQVSPELRMRFSTPSPSGREVAHTHDYVSSLTMDLVYTPTGGWSAAAHASPPQNDPWEIVPLGEQMAQSLCDAGGQDLQDALRHAHQDRSFNSGSSSSPPGMRGIHGCRMAVSNTNELSNASPAFLWRFGVLLAANTAAHKLLPGVPMAPKDELAAVPEQSNWAGGALAR